ncbi:NAD(P)H-hydrate dehydratase [Clostridiales bacterium COT073_COT-073]|nr:NAD(P)H-hydrate dehydratase [Clostridiales bacterium COT073_COT-073]
MNYVLSPQEMRQIDKNSAFDFHIPGLLLMEHAGYAVLKEIEKSCLPHCKVAIIIGSGNNGGDGLALARLLHQKKYTVNIYFLTEIEELTADATINYNIITALEIDYKKISKIDAALIKEWENADILIDAILGTGTNRELTGLYYDAVKAINECHTLTYSIDIPSGLNGETGMPMGIAVKADKTIVLAAYKTGNLLGKAKAYSGEMVLADIGIPDLAYEALDLSVFALSKDVFQHFPVQDPLANKGTRGKALIIGGSSKMGGALLLAAEAAYRSGAGLVYAYTTENNYAPLLARLPEVIVSTYSERREEIEKHEFYQEIENKNVVLIGPGLSTSNRAYELLQMTLSSKLPLVIDADALNLLAEHPKLLHLCIQRSEIKILTPHLKEMERLSGLTVKQIENNMIEVATRYARNWNAIVVLKNHRSVIAFPDGKCYINLLGNEGMATGGSGDVLAGYLAGLIAGSEPADYELAVLYGVYRHSLAGDLAANYKGQAAMLASDIITEL